MDTLNWFLLGYAGIVVLFLGTALALHLTGHRGRLWFSSLLTGLAGILAPLVIYLAYPFINPPPVSPPAVVNQASDDVGQLGGQLFAQFFTGLLSLGPAIAYDMGRWMQSLIYGLLTMLFVFFLSAAVYRNPRSVKPTPAAAIA